MTVTGLLAGKRILVTGIADEGSIAHATAARAVAQGATVVATAMPRDLDGARAAVAAIDPDLAVLGMDATNPDDLERVGAWIAGELGGLDGALHAIAFAPKAALGTFLDVASAPVELAFRTSVHTYVALGQLLADLAPPAGASIVGLDFDASRAWTTYNWMGVCKGALESANRYLARDLGPRGIRANLVAAGPLETRAATAIPGFDELLRSWEERAALAWHPDDATPVADAVCFLLSDLARAITGGITHVDGGHHAMS
jgi:meromycolic acid enoyl-[acyl-carrier-protein] reductase